MGIFSRLMGRTTTPTPPQGPTHRSQGVSSPGARDRVVTVAFRPLDDLRPLPDPWPWAAYSYIWPFEDEPSNGDWAIAPGMDGPTPVVVVSLERSEASRGMTLTSLIRPMAQDEVEQVQGPVRDRTLRFLEHARLQAGLPPLHGDLTPDVAGEFTAVVPPQGDATLKQASAYADAWWQATRLARQMGRDVDEVDAFAEAGRYWGRLRSRLCKVQHDGDLARELEQVDVAYVATALPERTAAQIDSLQLAGKTLPDWLEVVQALERAGRWEEALQLVEVLIEAAEQEAARSGREPAPAYTERAAIMLRRRKDYDAEIQVLERWEAFCPPERRGPGTTQQKLAARLVKARQLAAKTR